MSSDVLAELRGRYVRVVVDELNTEDSKLADQQFTDTNWLSYIRDIPT